MTLPLLQVQDLSKAFPLGRNWVRVVQGISFELLNGEILGIAGESGCGKSTLGKLLLRLLPSTSGSILYKGQSIDLFSGKRLKEWRRAAQMVFQHPGNALNPRMTVENILREPFQIHRIFTAAEQNERIKNLLNEMKLSTDFLKRVPHQLSGGQKQRISIARALALEPELLICDEPFSALDVSVQGQLIHLLKELHQKLKFSCLLISHDLAVMRYLTHRLAVMYLGQFVEHGPTHEVFEHPLHPYTQALFEAMPNLENKKKVFMMGEISNVLSAGPGCPFEARCPLAMPVCKQKKPLLKQVRPNHFTACHAYNDFML
ncbi:MAG: ABC transporter ATP-binding protein [Candidatus Protochlamydia sp.]|nr:ABC transporter ATP-binding protein [Candidatus Protochlamydia sp.]